MASTSSTGRPKLKLVKFPKLVDRTEEGVGRFYTLPDGLVLPSVTTVLKHYPGKQEALSEWRERVGEDESRAVSTHASNHGNSVHALLEHFVRGTDPIEPQRSRIEILRGNHSRSVKTAQGMIQSLREHVSTVYGIEAPLYSKELGLAGRTDLIGLWDGIPSIIDFKTSRKPKRKNWIYDYFCQGVAYSLAFEEMYGVQFKQIVIIIGVSGWKKPQIFIENRDDYKKKLFQVIDLYNKAQEKVA